LWVSGAIDLGDGGCEEEGDGSDYASCYDNNWWLGFGVGGVRISNIICPRYNLSKKL
jgi:hypothetical protein